MAIRYYKLLDMLNRKNLKKGDLQNIAGISSATIAKLSKGDNVNVEVIDRICSALGVQPGDIMEHVPDED